MNKIRNILYVCMALLALACTNENMDPEGNWTLTPPTATSPRNETITLDADNPTETIDFVWEEAASSARYSITYGVVLLDASKTDSSATLSTLDADDYSAQITYEKLDELLSIAGYSTAAEVSLNWVVVANCVGTIATDTASITVIRSDEERLPESLYLTGAATEKGSVLDSAVIMTRLDDSAHVFEAYNYLSTSGGFQFYSSTSLPAYIYGGSAGAIVSNGEAITVSEEGIYRITVDLDNNIYSLQLVETLGVIGDPFTNGWDSDESLEYQGNGVWQAELEVVSTGSFAIRLNNSWDYMYKVVSGTTNQLIMESVASSYNVDYEDISMAVSGTCSVTVSLSNGSYTYNVELLSAATDPVDTPDALYLLDSDNNLIGEFTKDGDTFTATAYLALQSSVSYTLNSAEDGSGTSYSLNAYIGATDDATADKVSGTATITASSSSINVSNDQAYLLSFDFSTVTASWYYYNLTMFEWDNDGGWDERAEVDMTYSHPFTYTVTADLTAGYDLKFYSPWEVEFGAKEGVDDASASSGSTTNKALQDDDVTNNNFNFTTSDGSYTITLVVASDYATGTYSTVSN